jgi:hypothetical protein
LTKHNEAHLAAPKVIVAPIVLSKVALTVPGWLWRTRVVDRCEGNQKEQEKKRKETPPVFSEFWLSERFFFRACLGKWSALFMMRKGAFFFAPALELV